MRILIWETPEFVVTPLVARHEAGMRTSACSTQPDRLKGRHEAAAPPVKETALELGFPSISLRRCAGMPCGRCSKN